MRGAEDDREQDDDGLVGSAAAEVTELREDDTAAGADVTLGNFLDNSTPQGKTGRIQSWDAGVRKFIVDVEAESLPLRLPRKRHACSRTVTCSVSPSNAIARSTAPEKSRLHR